MVSALCLLNAVYRSPSRSGPGTNDSIIRRNNKSSVTKEGGAKMGQGGAKGGGPCLDHRARVPNLTKPPSSGRSGTTAKGFVLIHIPTSGNRETRSALEKARPGATGGRVNSVSVKPPESPSTQDRGRRGGGGATRDCRTTMIEDTQSHTCVESKLGGEKCRTRSTEANRGEKMLR